MSFVTLETFTTDILVQIVFEDIDVLLRKTYQRANRQKAFYFTYNYLNCLTRYTSEAKLKEHEKICGKGKPQKYHF
jgi:hypothetical protein